MRAIVGACIALTVVAGIALITVFSVREAGDVGWVIAILVAGSLSQVGVHVFQMLSDRIETNADRVRGERVLGMQDWALRNRRRFEAEARELNEIFKSASRRKDA